MNYTDMYTGWVYPPNNASVHVVDAWTQFVSTVPYLVTGLDFDNGSEFINHNLIDWAAERKIFFARGRPYTKTDQATIESKNSHLVRRYGFYYRYDTPTELDLLKRLWVLVTVRLNYFTPTKKPTGYAADRVGRRKRLYDAPKTPYRRLLDSGMLNAKQKRELEKYRAGLDPVGLAAGIDQFQQRLIKLAAGKTARLEREIEKAQALPDPAGIKVHHTQAGKGPGWRGKYV